MSKNQKQTKEELRRVEENQALSIANAKKYLREQIGSDKRLKMSLNTIIVEILARNLPANHGLSRKDHDEFIRDTTEELIIDIFK